MRRFASIGLAAALAVPSLACVGDRDADAGATAAPAVSQAPAPAAAPAAAADPAAAPRMSLDDFRQARAKGEVVVVDVRSREDYDLGHVKGAVNIPLGEVPARAGELPRDKTIVTYCA